jgi:hypothetical protein
MNEQEYNRVYTQRRNAEFALHNVRTARDYYDEIHGFIGIKAKLDEVLLSLEYAVNNLKEREDKLGNE